MRVPRTIFRFSLDFPIEDVVGELKRKNLLKNNTKIEISTGPAFDPGAPLATAFIANLNKNLIMKYYWPLFFIYITALWLNILNFMPLLVFVIVLILWILFTILNTIIRTQDMHWSSMGYIEKTSSFTEFLDKFGRGWEAKIGELPEKIIYLLSLHKALGFDNRKWIIEYDILAGAVQWHKKDPAGFKEGLRKANNKKELRQILTIR